MRQRCAFCRSYIGTIRCRAMESVIESSIVHCRYSIHGCNETTSYGNQSRHETLCVFFVPCFCPLPNCDYTGSYTELKRHARASHDEIIPFVLDRSQIFGLDLSKKRMFVFQEVEEGDLVVVQAFKGLYGVSVTVSSVAPMAPEVRDLSCSVANLNGCSTVIRLGLMVKKVQRVREQEQPRGGFLLIPNDDDKLCGDHLKLQICIGSECKFEL